MIDRRGFLRAGVMGGASAMLPRLAGATPTRVSLVVDPEDPVASAPTAAWAIGALERALAERGVDVCRVPRVEEAGGRVVVVAGRAQPDAVTSPAVPPPMTTTSFVSL